MCPSMDVTICGPRNHAEKFGSPATGTCLGFQRVFFIKLNGTVVVME